MNLIKEGSAFFAKLNPGITWKYWAFLLIVGGGAFIK